MLEASFLVLATKLLRLPAGTDLAYPFSALVLTFIGQASMAQILHDRGVGWRGTLYPLDELRRNRI